VKNNKQKNRPTTSAPAPGWTLLARLTLLMLAGILLASCSTDIAAIDRMAIERLELDSGDGRGFQPYDGGQLPPSPAGHIVSYRFRIEFSLPQDGSLRQPTLVVGPNYYPYRLSLNGQTLSHYGYAEDRNRTRRYASSLSAIDPALLQRRNVIEVEAWISGERTPLMVLAISDAQPAAAYVFWRNFFMTQLSTGIMTVSFLLLIYFLFMYAIGQGKNLQFLWFALFCGGFMMANFNIALNHLSLSDTLLTKLSRIGFFGGMAVMSFYVMEATDLLRRFRPLKFAMAAVAALASILVLAQPDFNATNNMFHVVMNFAITPHLIFCVVLIVISIFKAGLKKNLYLVLGFSVVLLTSFYDMGYENKNLIPYIWTVAYGFIWLVLCIFFELASRQEAIFKTTLLQTEAISDKNAILQTVFKHLGIESGILTRAAEEIAVSAREVSVTGNQQAAAVREIVATMENASELLTHISGQSSQVAKASDDSAARATDGAANVRTALKKLEAVIARIAESINMINSFNDELGSITEIVKFIEGIATQIRIIAFNASLEAVAAGDAGRNFRIVADEVKRLADSTMSSVKNIRARVNSLIASSGKVVNVARDGYSALEQSWDIASNMGESFSGIVESTETSAAATLEINTSLQEESQAFRQILQALKEISGGVNSFVDSANYTSETSKQLNDIAEKLHSLISQYSDTDAPPPEKIGGPAANSTDGQAAG